MNGTSPLWLMLLAQKLDTKGGFRTFAAVNSNGRNAQVATFAKFADLPSADVRSDRSERRP